MTLIFSRYLPRGDAEEGHPHSEDKHARRNGETSAAGPRGVIRERQGSAPVTPDSWFRREKSLTEGGFYSIIIKYTKLSTVSFYLAKSRRMCKNFYTLYES